jgi:Transcriptional regulatory protein, C terminal
MDEQVLSPDPECRQAARVVMLRGASERHGALVRAFALAGAVVEDVAEIPALLARMNRDPRPDFVVLGLEGAGGGEALRRAGEFAIGAAVGRRPKLSDGAESARTRDALMRLLRSAEMLVAAANEEPEDGAVRNGARNDVFRADGLELRLDASRALWKGRRVDLSLTEFRIVSRMARLRGRDFSHRELYDVIKGDGFVSGQGSDGYRCNVRAAIKRIRQKFRLADPEFAAIRSYHGFGYRWEDGMEGGGTDGGGMEGGTGEEPPGGCAPQGAASRGAASRGAASRGAASQGAASRGAAPGPG